MLRRCPGSWPAHRDRGTHKNGAFTRSAASQIAGTVAAVRVDLVAEPTWGLAGSTLRGSQGAHGAVA